MRSAPAWSHLVTLPLPHAARHAAPQALEEPARRVLLRRELSARLGSGKADFDAKLLLDELPKVSFLGGEAPWDRPLPSLLCAATAVEMLLRLLHGDGAPAVAAAQEGVGKGAERVCRVGCCCQR